MGTDEHIAAGRSARLEYLTPRVGTPFQQRVALEALCIEAFGVGDYARVATLAAGFDTLPSNPRDPQDGDGLQIRHRFGAHAAHYLGDHAAARRHAALMSRHASEPGSGRVVPPVPARVVSGIQEARILWLEGHADRALQEAQRALVSAEDASPFGRSQVMAMGVVPVLLWRGDDVQAAVVLDRLVRLVRNYGQGYWSTWLHGFCEVLALRGVDVADLRARLLPAPAVRTSPRRTCSPRWTRASAAPRSSRASRTAPSAGARPRSCASTESASPTRPCCCARWPSRRRKAPARGRCARRAVSPRCGMPRAGGRRRTLLAEALAGFTEGLDCADPRRARALLARWRDVS